VLGKVELYLRKPSNQIGYVIGYGLEFSRRYIQKCSKFQLFLNSNFYNNFKNSHGAVSGSLDVTK
jgi:hypothetical protein